MKHGPASARPAKAESPWLTKLAAWPASIAVLNEPVTYFLITAQLAFQIAAQ